MKLTFDADHLRRLLSLSRASEEKRPTYDQIVDPDMWRDDLDPARLRTLRNEDEDEGVALSATPDDVDPGKIGAGLILVGDQGVYLMSQAPVETCRASGVPHVAYAAEADPENLPFDDWWNAKQEFFGGDDGTVFIPESTIEWALETSGERITMRSDAGDIAIDRPGVKDDSPEP